MAEDKHKEPLPPVDLIENMQQLFNIIVKFILKRLPLLFGALTAILLLIVGFLLWVFGGVRIEP